MILLIWLHFITNLSHQFFSFYSLDLCYFLHLLMDSISSRANLPWSILHSYGANAQLNFSLLTFRELHFYFHSFFMICFSSQHFFAKFTAFPLSWQVQLPYHAIPKVSTSFPSIYGYALSAPFTAHLFQGLFQSATSPGQVSLVPFIFFYLMPYQFLVNASYRANLSFV